MLTGEDIEKLLGDMARAYRAQDAKACAALFADTAQLHSSFGQPAIGRDEIETLHRDWVSEPNTKTFALIDHGSTDTLAWCLARFSEGDKTGSGTSLVVWERCKNAQWLIRSCCLHDGPETE